MNELGVYLNQCHKSRREVFVKAEIQRRQELIHHEERFPQLKLGWLLLNYQMVQEDEKFAHQSEEDREYTALKIAKYTLLAREFFHRTELGKSGDVEHQQKMFSDKHFLLKQIERQKRIILSQAF